MKIVAILVFLSILLFIGFLISFILGLIKKRKDILITSIIAFLAFIAIAG